MWEEEVLPRALQNHLLQARHRTTELGLCIPQYLEMKQTLAAAFRPVSTCNELTRKRVLVILSPLQLLCLACR